MRSPNRLAGLTPFLALSATFLAFIFQPGTARAQGLEGELGTLAFENAERYVEPLTQGLAYAMSGGLFDGASPLGRLGFDIGVRAMGALPPASAERFDPILPESVEWEGQTYQNPYRIQPGGPTTSPTAVGVGSGVILEPDGSFRTMLIASGESPEDFQVQFPEGVDIPAIPFPILHASLGIGFGTEVSARFIPAIEVDEEVGEIGARGFAIRHQLNQWLPGVLPIDLSAVFGTQSLEVGEYLEASSSQFGLIAGRGMGPLSLFATGLMRSGSVDITYTVDNPNDNPGLPADGTRISFADELDSGAAFGVGARLSLLFMNISGQYTLDEYPVASLKVGFGM